uniref:Uncharacterized protein n=1 Tax=Anguilla anguilla TaxID=7936 RepID=A0A0E9RUM0_ANGAN
MASYHHIVQACNTGSLNCSSMPGVHEPTASKATLLMSKLVPNTQ